jgi:hypothetical protein
MRPGVVYAHEIISVGFYNVFQIAASAADIALMIMMSMSVKSGTFFLDISAHFVMGFFLGWIGITSLSSSMFKPHFSL